MKKWSFYILLASLSCTPVTNHDEVISFPPDSLEDSMEPSNLSRAEQFKSAFRILDRWIIDGEMTCDVCESSTTQFVALADIVNALDYIETTTGMESEIEFNLGTAGILLTDGSAYPSEKKKWKQWLTENELE